MSKIFDGGWCTGTYMYLKKINRYYDSIRLGAHRFFLSIFSLKRSIYKILISFYQAILVSEGLILNNSSGPNLTLMLAGYSCAGSFATHCDFSLRGDLSDRRKRLPSARVYSPGE